MRKLIAVLLAMLLAISMPILNTRADETEPESQTPAAQEPSTEEGTGQEAALPEDDSENSDTPGEEASDDTPGAPGDDPLAEDGLPEQPEEGEEGAEDPAQEKPRESRDHPAASKSLASWEEERKELRLTGNLREDILIIARSQIGYSADRSFFERDEAGNERYYTRYGEWYGWPFADWCDMFVSFCVHFAGAENYPAEASCARHMFRLKRAGYWREWNCYVPRRGDIVFFRFNSGDMAPNHAGIIEKVVLPKGDEPGHLVTIEGNMRNPDGGAACVRRMTRSLENVVGYGTFEKGLTYPEAYSVPSDGWAIIDEDSPYFVEKPTEDAMAFLGLVGSRYYEHWFPGEAAPEAEPAPAHGQLSPEKAASTDESQGPEPQRRPGRPQKGVYPVPAPKEDGA